MHSQYFKINYMQQYMLSFLLLLPLTLIAQKNTEITMKHFELPEGISKNDYIPNTLVIKFKKIPDNETLMVNSEVVQSLSKSVSITAVKQLFKSQRLSTTSSVDPQGLDRIIEIKYQSDKDITWIINHLLSNPNVEYAEPKYIYQSNASIPNDYNSTNQSFLAKIQANTAWGIANISTPPMIIAIIDSGSQLDHPDLAANIYDNSTADPTNGIDDDGDGYIDNAKGWDFTGCCSANPTPDNNPNITVATAGHGVHISGLASAVTNNGIGVASIAYNTAKLLILKASADNDPTRITQGYEAIQYAADHGAQIINCSWGGPYSSAFAQNIINYALGKGCLIIAAAGNTSKSAVDYPAAYSGVLAVASVSNADRISSFSNYGPQIAISAPGENIRSTWYNNTYITQQGTSMATAIVSSAAALIKAKYPSWTMQQVGQHIKNTADNINHLNPGYEGLMGTGRLNVYNAINSPTTPIIDDTNVTTLNLKQNHPNPAYDNTYIDFDVPEDGNGSLILYNMIGQPIRQIFNTTLYKGPFRAPVYVGDLPAGIYIYQVRWGNLKQSSKLIVK